MNIYDIIEKKRDKLSLTEEEIKYLVDSYVKGITPDYQISAFLMATYLNKMNQEETYYLTKAMLESGDKIKFDVDGVKVDKHSTGGIGDKTTLIIGPIVASLGVLFPKMSGRGLGYTGGTIDKLESIKGFDTNLSISNFTKNLKDIGISIAGQTGNLVPADKKIYGLRDVTATVENNSLIAASIMSKKLAIETDKILIDVKVGSGAFMKTEKEAIDLSKLMIDIGDRFGREVICVLTNMNQPLGFTIGNSLEVKEAIEVLKGNGPKDITDLSKYLSKEILLLSGVCKTSKEAFDKIEESIKTGKAFNKFEEMVIKQSGNLKNIQIGKEKTEIKALKTGFISKIEANMIGKAALLTGAGRKTKSDIIDHSAGIELFKKTGQKVIKNDIIGYVYGNDKEKNQEALEEILKSIEIIEDSVNKENLIIAKISKYKIERYGD